MMEIEEISEMLVFNSALTWLIVREVFRIFIHHECFKSYIITKMLKLFVVKSNKCPVNSVFNPNPVS
jgi:hypothetical protein